MHLAQKSSQLILKNQQINDKQYAQEVQTWEEMKRHTYTIANAVAGALAKRFPADFGWSTSRCVRAEARGGGGT